MSLIDTTPPAQTDAISFEIELRHAPAKVWRALTEPALLSQWLLPSLGLTLQTGATFRLLAPAFPGWDGVVRCQMLEIEEHRKLSYSWVVGDMELRTVVTFTLTPTESGTRLSLVQSGFQPSQKQNFGGARYGWRMMGERLIELLARAD